MNRERRLPKANTPYSCTICHEIFSRKDNLKRHTEQKHMERKECEACGALLYTRTDNLKQHMKLHNIDVSLLPAICDEQRFHCPFCCRNFLCKAEYLCHIELNENIDDCMNYHIVGVTIFKNEICYTIKWKKTNKIDFVTNIMSRKTFPLMIIKYYEKQIINNFTKSTNSPCKQPPTDDESKNKNTESTEDNMLQKLINWWRSKSEKTSFKENVERLELLNVALTNEVATLKEKLANDENSKQTKQELEKLNSQLNEERVRYEQMQEQIKKFESSLLEERKKLESFEELIGKLEKERRLLHNVIQNYTRKIRVFCRVRPKTVGRTLQKEQINKALCDINFIDDCTIEIGEDIVSDEKLKEKFSFDKVFTSEALQVDVFKELSPLVQSAFEGYNVCVFAYGRTGSGKTYTMEGECGSEETEGIIPRVIRYIFNEIEQFKLCDWEYKVKVSFLEIYNEEIIDLLTPQSKEEREKCKIRMSNDKCQYVSNLKIKEIQSAQELKYFFEIAQDHRRKSNTPSNNRSSRSHSVATIQLIGTHATNRESTIGTINLIDLAGSECLQTKEATAAVETKNINKSLSNLNRVILALRKKQKHIPYRDSKLTHLLMPFLEGNSKTLMFVNISQECYKDTVASLRFANNVNICKTGNIKKNRSTLAYNNNNIGE